VAENIDLIQKLLDDTVPTLDAREISVLDQFQTDFTQRCALMGVDPSNRDVLAGIYCGSAQTVDWILSGHNPVSALGALGAVIDSLLRTTDDPNSGSKRKRRKC